jgi:hypothetical protein
MNKAAYGPLFAVRYFVERVRNFLYAPLGAIRRILCFPGQAGFADLRMNTTDHSRYTRGSQ